MSTRAGGLPAALKTDGARRGSAEEEWGSWFYLVTDAAGIRPRLDSCYSKDSKSSAPRFAAGAVVEVVRRRRAGWTRWLEVSSGEGWLFDVSPKDRRVRLVEVEVQQGEWAYEVCVERLPVIPRPQLGADARPSPTALRTGDAVKAVERVRPLLGRGAFLKLSGADGWVVDFLDGKRTLRAQQQAKQAQDGAADSDLFLSLTPAARGAGALAEPELGEWSYVVVDPKGITLRSSPTCDKGAKVGSHLDQGELVTVVERRAGAGVRFLRLASSWACGWAFEQQPGKSSVLRMAEVHLEDGSWFYRVVSERGLALRRRLTTSADSKAGAGPLKGAILRIGQRVRVGGTTFLRLKDGTGWVFDRKDGRAIAEGPLDAQPMRSAGATVVAEDGMTLLAAPTAAAWAQTKLLVLPCAKVLVHVKLRLGGETWAEVSRPGAAMQGWLPMEALDLDDLVLSTPGWAREARSSEAASSES